MKHHFETKAQRFVVKLFMLNCQIKKRFCLKFLVFAPIYTLFRGLKVLLSKCTINNK